jgi:hypothetical protein
VRRGTGYQKFRLLGSNPTGQTNIERSSVRNAN